MAADLITTDDLLLALGSGGTEKLRQLAGTAADGTPVADRLAYGLSVASEQAYGILMSGFVTTAAVAALAAEDVDVRHQIAMIAREVLAEGNEQFRTPDGKNSFASSARTARDVLREKARGARRTSAETAPGVGQSRVLRPRGSDGCTTSIFGRGRAF
jgi:hypothetical protein